MTSSGEIVDFELTERMELEDFRRRLEAQLPEDIPLYSLEEVELKKLAATRLLEKAEYLLTFEAGDEAGDYAEWKQWIDGVNSSEEIWWEKTTKSGKKQQVNLRDRLYSLTINSESSNQDQVELAYVGSCRNDGTLLQPEHVVYMLEQIGKQELQLLKAHRQQLILNNEQ